VEAKTCGRCLGWTDSLEKVREILNNQFSACEGCAHQAQMQVVTEQFRMRLPRWWVVQGNVVVPIWIVELLKKHPEI
jgi:hypothetical protein